MKLKRLIFFLFACQTMISAYSQTRLVEGELGCGATVGSSNKKTTGAIIDGELRLNLKDGKVSPAFQLSQSNLGLKDTDYHERYTTLQVLCDYNFQPGKKVSPFAGCGVGMAIVKSDNWNISDDNTPLVVCRVGCEFFKRIRFTTDYRLQKGDYSYFTFRLGFVIGG